MLFICINLGGVMLKGQNKPDSIYGKISFIAPENIYVRFRSTEGLSAGDTLYSVSEGKLVPVLKINFLSSASCVCTALATGSFFVSQEITGLKKIKVEKATLSDSAEVSHPNALNSPPTDTLKSRLHSDRSKSKIDGSLSVYSYSDLSNSPVKNSTQLRYTYELNAHNISNSKFSIENYITFRHKIGDWSLVKSDVFNALKIYRFDIIYAPDKNTRISVGRSINNKISSIGAMDGLWVEKSLKKISIGAVAGFRPDYKDYGFNSNLLQYGAYLSLSTRTGNLFSESTLALMEQMNHMKTDRRFLYFQHSGSLVKNLFFFGTFEIDLFRLKNDIRSGAFDLRSLYLSLRYNLTRNLTITGSYDQRKNILFYETYKSLIDSVLANEKRQSIRLQASYRISHNIYFSLGSVYSFLNTDPRHSRNFTAFISYYQIPGLNVNLNLNGTYLESAYMNGRVIGSSVSKDFLKGKIQTSFGYHFIDYTLPESKLNIVQHIGEAGLFYQLNTKLFISANYEGTFEKNNKYSRVYLQIRKRF
jgi:hypothetical protein